MTAAGAIPETDFLKLKIAIHLGWRRDPDDGNLTGERYEYVKILSVAEVRVINAALDKAHQLQTQLRGVK